MFKDLNGNDILKAINELIKEGNLRPTQYSVWYNKTLFSPSAIITKAFKIKGKELPRRSFNTDLAQKRLLELGFPTIGYPKNLKKGFFSNKLLNSFSKLVQRHEYDKENPIDVNIGRFLNLIPWGKTKQWAQEIEKHGWIIKGRKNWNEQRNNKSGQGYKGYTWFRIYPEEYVNELIYFTIGIHDDGSLLVKLDIERSNEFFDKETQTWFDQRKKKLGATWHQININIAKNLSLKELAEESINYFNKNLDNYFTLTNELWPDKRLMRLTWNTNNWEIPTQHKWKKSNQGKHNIAYENQYGYGHEEWLFNPRYRLDGIQYGYIKGIEQMSEDYYFLNEIHLFTIDGESKDRYLIAKLINVEIINGLDKEPSRVKHLFRKYLNQMVDEVKEIKGDYRNFRKTGFYPNIKFTWEEIEIYKQPYVIDSLRGRQYNRFQPYHLDENLKELITDVTLKGNKLNFTPGKARSTRKYKKKISGGESMVTRSHTDITDDMDLYLKKIVGYSEDEVSVERSTVGNAIVDVLIKRDDEYIFFEVKTRSSAILNIREALGQLFEYAFLDSSISVNKLVIVGPALIKNTDLAYFRRLQEVISKPLEYWAYNYNKENLKDKFVIII